MEQDSGVVPGRHAVDPKSNEIPAVREPAGGLDLRGRVVTFDAIRVRQETARFLL